MANKKHSLVSKKKGSLHKSGGVNKGAVIGFTIGSVLLVGGAAGGVVGIYFYLKTTPVQLLSVSGDASQGGTTSNIFLTFDQNMGDSSI
ncbi:hypothetical protein FACS1894218_5730 [Bacilli bacterium]|nr:hypothetical protein FACS1894218_5730 [Bacilli bacterium]